jgi:hypothetical protein
VAAPTDHSGAVTAPLQKRPIATKFDHHYYPSPPEPPICRLFLGINVSSRPVRTRVKSPRRYVYAYTWGIAR